MKGKRHMKQHMKGTGLFEDIDKFLKKSKILSNIGQVALPVLGGLAGTALAGPGGTAIGSASGLAGANVLKNLGYGSKKMHGMGYNYKPLMIGRGVPTVGPTGVIQPVPMRMRGMGSGAEFGTVSSQFGKIQG